jgi:hypothetical protein
MCLWRTSVLLFKPYVPLVYRRGVYMAEVAPAKVPDRDTIAGWDHWPA